MTHVRSGWRWLTCQTLTLAMVLVGLTIVATPPAHAVADAVVFGTVVELVTQQPLSSVTVTDSTSGRSTTTAAQGTYSLSLPPGDHVLTATLAGYVPSSTPKLTLTAGQTLTSQGFTLQPYASASGVVTEKGTTTGIATVVVKLFDASTESPNPDFAATTGPDGSWSIAHVAPGTYKVQFDGTGTGYANQWYVTAASRDAAAVFTLVAGGNKTIAGALSRQTVTSTSTTVAPRTTAQATVTAQSVGNISGHVTIEPGGTPAVGANVTAIAPNASVNPSVATDATGAYSFVDLPSGYYIVMADSWGMNSIQGYLGGAVSPALATYVMVGDGLLTGQDIHLQRKSTISGTVTDRGLPVAQAQASLIGMGLRLDSVLTQADGSFQITAIPPGTYRLSVTYGDQVVWWNNASDIGGATEIAVQADSNLTGYSMALPPRYTLSGTVRTAGGTAVPDARVAVINGTNKSIVTANQAGSYAIHNLAAGTYELGIVDAAGTVNWSPGSSSPDLFTIASDNVRDVAVEAQRTITLNVAGSDGSVPASFSVWAFNARNGDFYNSGLPSNGRVDLYLPPGTYRIDISAANYRPWSSQIVVTSSTTIPVTLDVGGRIAGTVTGVPATVTAINATTGERFPVTVAAGPYSLGAMPAGEYVLTAEPLNSSWVPCGGAQWLGGTSYLTARRLHVDSGTSLTGANFVLSCDVNWTPGADLLGEVALPPSAPADAATGVVVSATNTVGSVSTVPGADGTFALLEMVPGIYEITAYQSALGLEAHATVMIAAGSPVILTLNLTKRGRITGRVLGPMNEPVRASVSNGETETQTDSIGNFSLGGISYGTHTLTVLPTTALYALTFVDVTVGAGSDVTGLTIRAPLAGTMHGQLAPSAGNVEVTVTDGSDRVVASDYFTYYFSFGGLPPGPVKVRFSGSGIVTEWWRDAADPASATAIQVPEGGGVTDIMPNLKPSAADESTTSISGTVTYAASPLGGVTIGTIVGSKQVTTTTAGDGTYSLTVPRGDTYSVKAEICLGPSTYVCSGQHFVDARDVVADSASVSGVDFVVPQPANSFTVAPQPVITGSPLLGQTLTATVGAWNPVPDTTSWQWYADGYAIYGATGTTVTLTDAEVGTQIQVVVTRAKAGYATITLPSVPTEPVEVSGAIHALTPSRLLDSRIGQGFQGPARNGTVITLPVWGKGGVPAGASAVLVNITLTQPTASGFLTAYASGGAAPWVSNANFTAGTTSANLSLVPVGADGAIALKTSVPGSAHVVADVQGYVVGGAVSAAGAVVPVTPTRVLDTRTTQHVGAKSTITLAVAGVAGVPVDAAAVVANLTVTGPSGSGYLTAWPSGAARPTASNVNFVANQTVPNMAIVKVGDNKSISIYNATSGPIDVVVDIQGYVTTGTATLPGTVMPLTPTRVVDTRLNLGADGPVPANTGSTVDFSSADLSAMPQGALINLTVTEPQASGWLSAYPYGVDRPLVSNLNFTAGMVVPNLSLATLNDGFAVLNNGSPGNV